MNGTAAWIALRRAHDECVSVGSRKLVVWQSHIMLRDEGGYLRPSVEAKLRKDGADVVLDRLGRQGRRLRRSPCWSGPRR